jgi:hypothetical protein
MNFAPVLTIKEMTMLKSVRILAIIAALVFMAALTSRSASVDPNQPDTVMVDSVNAYASATAGVIPVRFSNDEKLATVEITLKLSSSSLKVDSFSFSGGRASSAQLRDVLLNEDSSIVDLFFDIGTGQAIAPGSGLLGNLYVHWPNLTAPQVVPIDSVSWINSINVLHTTTFIDTVGNDFVPRFKPGLMNIQADPIRYDSLWIAHVQATAGEQAVVDVSLFNDRDIKDVSLALSWGSDRLVFDSISYVGTRGAASPSKSLQTNNSVKQLLAAISYDVSAPLASGSGVLARIFFNVAATAPDTTITIDSTSYLGTQSTYLVLTPADASLQFTPIFRSGSVQLKSGTGVDEGGLSGLPKNFSLDQNYPNPFNPTTEIQFSLPRSTQVRLDIYNILGARVRNLVDRRMEAGVQRITFDGRADGGRMLASGIYFYRLSSSEFTQTKKMMLLK